jgi:hypothetical protein
MARLGKHDLENSCTFDEIVLKIDMKYFYVRLKSKFSES